MTLTPCALQAYVTARAIYMFKKYGPFYPDYIERVLQYGSIRDTAYFKSLHEMFAGNGYTDLKHDVDSVYPNLDKQNEAVTDAFRHIKYYFPKRIYQRCTLIFLVSRPRHLLAKVILRSGWICF